MRRTSFLDGRIKLWKGDCLEALAKIEENSIDSCVTDPPYHLVWPKQRPETIKSDQYKRLTKGFLGKEWDGGDIAFRQELWAAVYRVLKPGGYILAFSGTRTYHRMAVAIEDGGFVIRDQMAWMYGSGFPKGQDISKKIDKKLGLADQRGYVETKQTMKVGQGPDANAFVGKQMKDEPVSDEAKQWHGWNTALKPCWEPIAVGKKPYSGTIVDGVLEHGVGAYNIKGCAVEGNRHPGNIIHDGSAEATFAMPEGASRYFYSAKAQGDDRLDLTHPTVKPIDLMRYLVRLVTPVGGLVLDPFAGTGTTGEAAWHEQCDAVLIEREESYQADIARRMKYVKTGSQRRKELKQQPPDDTWSQRWGG